ncbi:MAG: PTS sugar transporter subunit IIA [Romboutsia sp.]|uniref:PTS sugar transporter subunit IIA n=1 Tax=Romboutsia sp. TaxID=1965302 RepID=UPI003F3A4665
MEANVFNKEHVFLNINANTKEEVLKFISKSAKELGITNDCEGVYNGLVERESQFTTNLGEFIAIPHTKNDAVINPAVLVLKFNEDVNWNEGEEKIKLAINLLMPGQSEGNTHLKLLSALSRKLIHEDFKDALLNSNDVEEVTALINEALGL